MDILKIFGEMDGFSRGIVGTLLLMAVASLSIFMERLWSYRRAARVTKIFSADAGVMLAKNGYNDLLSHAEKHKASPFAWLVAETMRFFLQARMTPGKLPLVERVRRDCERKLDAVASDLKRGHSVLASVGSVAPFVAAALAAVRTWHYSPALVDGQATAVFRIVKIPFRLRG